MSDHRDTEPHAAGAQAQHQQVKESMARVVQQTVTRDEPGGLDRLLRDYWWILTAAIAIAVAWGVSTAQIASVGEGVKQANVKIDSVSEQVAGLKAVGAYNARDIAELRDRVWKLEAKR